MLNVVLELALFVIISLLVTLFTAFVRVILQKWGVIEWGTVNLPKFFAKMLECNFCSAFWLASLLGLCFFIFALGHVEIPGLYLLIGVFVAPVSRLMA